MSGSNSYDVAIVGMSGRFPGADSPEALWELLRAGRTGISYFTDEELRSRGVAEQDLKDPDYVRAAPALDDVDQFDASFFALTPREAELMDPQQRLFMECCWEALEDAGYSPAAYAHPIGLFAGARTNTYLPSLLSHPGMLNAVGMFHLGLANDLAFMTSRVAHFMNLRGPACSLHTACSTSLVAVHLACQSLLLDECRMALAGGVAVNVPHGTGYRYEEGSVESPDGVCRAFDAGARGTVFGSGVGVVVLKRLKDALEDGDTIHAVIRGSAINNDGSTKASFTAPSVSGQVRVIRDALRNAKLEAASISYVECHATGTLLGDAIEVRALSKAFGSGSASICALGSLKSNVGHLDAAAGIAGLIKVVLSLKHRMLAPSINFTRINPQVHLDGTPFYVNSSLTPWVGRQGEPLRAGLSAFGVGGTNAHIILEQAPELKPVEAGRVWNLLPFSARTEPALRRAADRLASALQRESAPSLDDAAYTLQVGRERFAVRTSIVCRDRTEAIEMLREIATGPQALPDELGEGSEQEDPPIVFLFPGQGAQYAGMGSELYREEAVFRQQMDLCSKILQPHLDLPLTEVLYGSRSDETSALLEQTWFLQPALVAIEYALAQLLRSFGIQPAAMLGHSIGEYAAACVAGVMTLDQALPLIVARGRLMHQAAPGAMLAVSLSPALVTTFLTGSTVEIAAFNAPDLCTIAGPEEEIQAIEKRLESRGVNRQRLRTARAFHTAMLSGFTARYHAEIKKVNLSAPKIPFISNVSGKWITDAEAQDPWYWVKQMRHAVLFGPGVEELAKRPERVFLEVGPGQTLRRLVLRQSATGRGRLQIASMSGAGQEQRSLLQACGHLWEAGANVQWGSFQTGRRRVSLPAYPFDRKRFWIDPAFPQTQGAVTRTDWDGDETNPNLDEWFWTPSWQLSPVLTEARRDKLPEEALLVYMDDHGLGWELCLLAVEQMRVIRVLRGKLFEPLDIDVFGINPHDSADYHKLMKHLAEAGVKVSMVVHLWTPESPNYSAVQSPLEAAGVPSVLHAVQAVLQHGAGDTCRFAIVASGMVHVESMDRILPQQAALIAFARVVPHETRKLCCVCVDTQTLGSKQQLKLIAKKLLEELRSAATSPVVALRGHHRWVENFVQVQLGQAELIRRPQNGANYVILGGLGGVGLTIAGQMSQLSRPRLVLVARTPLPPREEWQQLLQENTSSKVLLHQLSAIREMETAGANVELAMADITDEAELTSLLNSIEQRFGRIEGLIHAAGATRDASAFRALVDMRMEDIEEQAKLKMQGIAMLRKVLVNRPIGFVLLVSSNSAAVGGLGFLAYTAANLAMGAHAVDQDLKQGRTSWICSYWDHWPEIETPRQPFEVRFDEGQIVQALEQKHRYGLTKAQAQQAVLRVVQHTDSGQIFITKGDLSRRLRPAVHHEPKKPAEPTGDRGMSTTRIARPNIKSVYVAPRNDLETQIAQVWKDLLGLDDIGIHDDFFELGGHSILAARLVVQTRAALDSQLTLTQFFAAPTVAGMAAMLAPTPLTAVPARAGNSLHESLSLS